jgi:RNA polymerase sigma-70 factor (ECF subfamily)
MMTGALLCAVFEDGGFGSDNRLPESGTGEQRTPSSRAERPMFDLPPDLAARIRARDPAALETLMHATLEPLVRFAYGFVHSYDAAEDVVQEVFVRVWARGKDWDPTIALTTYLYAAVRNRALNYLRANAAQIRLHERVQSAGSETAWMYAAPHGTSPEQLAQWNELMTAFDAAVKQLTERQRSALLLRFEQGQTVPEIAHILGISAKAAEKLISRGIRDLRTQLKSVIR